jgi:hypothetical protein
VFIVIVNMVFTRGICMYNVFFHMIFFGFFKFIYLFIFGVHVNLMWNEKIVNITFSRNVDFS